MPLPGEFAGFRSLMRIRPYRALRPVPVRAEQIASLPYDVVSTAEARKLTEGNPLSMLHVVRADLEFPDGTNPYADAVYARARANLDRLRAEGHLVREEEPCLYVYRQQMGSHQQTGLVALCHVDDYDAGLIKRHEKTRRDKEDDRTRLTNELGANPGPVFLTYRDQFKVDSAVAAATATEPLYDFRAHDGIQHTVWRVRDPVGLVQSFRDIPHVYVADGHHRAASAARVARERQKNNPHHSGAEDYNWFLTVLFPASQLQILPYNRLVLDLNGNDVAGFLTRLRTTGPVAVADDGTSSERGDIRVYVDGQWYSLRLEAPEGADPVTRLDVSLLQDRVLEPILGVDDPRTSKRVEFVGGIRGSHYLEDEVNEGRAGAAFALHPVTVDQLMDIADAGQIMPPKSTWFEPKLRSGLFMHVF